MKYSIIFCFNVLTTNLVFGHTCDPQIVKCPIDDTSVEFCVTMSMTTFGNYYDFQEQGAIGSHYQELINSCPKCHYSGFLSDFSITFSEITNEEITKFLSKYDNIKIDDALECKIAGELKEFEMKENNEISNCFLIGSYLLRMDSTRIDFRKEMQFQTKKFLIKAIENNEYDDPDDIATLNYLIGEMCRRTANFSEAIIYYEKAIYDPNKKDWVEKVATKQKELAINGDENNNI